jgi:hypothetical protein
LFRTDLGELIDERWKQKWSSFPDKMKLYDELQANAKKLVLHEAIRLRNSDDSNTRKLGELVLSQHTDVESAAILRQITQPCEEKSNGPRDQHKTGSGNRTD